MKQCSKCKEWKDESDFHKDKNRKSKLRSWCKECRKKASKKYQEANKEKIAEQKRKYQEANKEKIKKYYEENKEKWLEIIKEKFGSLSCSNCGYNKNFAAIEFHSEKDHTQLGKLMTYKPTPERIAELDKGILLCANCHRELHHPL